MQSQTSEASDPVMSLADVVQRAVSGVAYVDKEVVWVHAVDAQGRKLRSLNVSRENAIKQFGGPFEWDAVINDPVTERSICSFERKPNIECCIM
jgi:hypothetical protein